MRKAASTGATGPIVDRIPQVVDVFTRLLAAYGPQHWWPGDSPLEVIVGAVLTQSTAWTNVEKAIAELKRHRLLSLSRLLTLTPKELAPVIRSSGFHNQKARRLLALLNWIQSRGGIAALARIPTARLREQLLSLPGIGPETADSILLYALDRPVFVIDAYTRRILGRVGLARGDEPGEDLRRTIEAALPRQARLYNEFHALLVRLGKAHCRVRPLCRGCPLE